VFWLLVNLGTAFLAAGVISSFQHVIQVLPLLAAFQTVVSGMGGNGSAQAMAVTIRGLATGNVDKRLLRHVLLRELIVGVLTGIVGRHLHMGDRGRLLSRPKRIQDRPGDLRRTDVQSRQRLRHRVGHPSCDEKTRLRSRPELDHLRHHLHRLRRLFRHARVGLHAAKLVAYLISFFFV
jgi:hypothetical protein